MVNSINAALIVINVALASYLVMKLDFPVIAYVYFIILLGLYFARWVKEIILICAAISIFYIFKFMAHNEISALLTGTLVALAAIVPYYFSIKTSRGKKAFLQRNSDLKNKQTETMLMHTQITGDKKKRESEYDRIMQFYISVREFSKNVSKEDAVSAIRKVFSNKVGITSVNIFHREHAKWMCLYCEPPFLERQWLEYIDSNRELINITKTEEIEKPQFCPKNEAAVFLPIRVQSENLGCIVLTCEKEYVERYVLEGRIFSPQISLSMKRMKMMGEVSDRARNDGLTGLYKRCHFIERLQNEIEREKRYPKGFFIMMLDIDWFKKVNDKFGHLTGDRVLVSVAKILSDSSKFGTFAGRYGGEEFIIFVPVSKEKEALAVAKEINKSVAAKKYKNGEEIFRITVSIGISCFPKNGITADELINAADKALYKAKESGRNKVIVYNGTEPQLSEYTTEMTSTL